MDICTVQESINRSVKRSSKTLKCAQKWCLCEISRDYFAFRSTFFLFSSSFWFFVRLLWNAYMCGVCACVRFFIFDRAALRLDTEFIVYDCTMCECEENNDWMKLKSCDSVARHVCVSVCPRAVCVVSFVFLFDIFLRSIRTFCLMNVNCRVQWT